ncbi:hypothetical protein L5515_006385 [Caenorhabditis briggsae]|uniref:DUF7809 domain-containing protein n=1 Tax=Caenorhabditis briggsae TaxID=6238 RepID=A0AAE9EVT5_CAEBR|nr:hypothetical protein L5515_006385 [Caenorhabditis briggsae]
MAHELLQSMKNKNMDVSEFEEEVLKMTNVATFNFREVAQKVKIGDMKNIEFIRINTRESNITPIPIPAPDGTYCVPATDALYDLISDITMFKKVLQRINRSQFGHIMNFFESVEHIFRHNGGDYFISMEDVEWIKAKWEKTYEENLKSSVAVKHIRKVRKGGFTEDDLDKELEYLNLYNCWPETKREVKWAYKLVTKERNSTLKLEDMHSAVFQCQMTILLENLPKLIPADWKCDKADARSNLESLLECSRGQLGMFQNVTALFQALVNFLTAPGCANLLQFDGIYMTVPLIHNSIKGVEYIYKKDVLELISLAVPCPFEGWQAELVRLAVKSRLKCFEAEWRSRFNSNCEMIKVDLKILHVFAANLFECAKALFKNTELCMPNLPDFSNVESTDGSYEMLKSFDEKYPIAKNKQFYTQMFSWVVTVGKLFKKVLEESFMSADDSKATVRLFKIGKDSYVMAHELLQSMKNKNMDVSEFEEKVLQMSNLATFNFREVAQKVKIGDMRNIEFIRLNSKVSTTAIPIPAPGGTYCVPATDALYDLISDMIVAKKVLQRIDRDTFEHIQQFFKSMEHIFPVNGGVFFISLDDVEVIKAKWEKTYEDHLKSSAPVKHIRKVRKGGFTEDDLDKELDYMNLYNSFPEMKREVEWAYKIVTKDRKSTLKLEDMHSAVFQCQLTILLILTQQTMLTIASKDMVLSAENVKKLVKRCVPNELIPVDWKCDQSDIRSNLESLLECSRGQLGMFENVNDLFQTLANFLSTPGCATMLQFDGDYSTLPATHMSIKGVYYMYKMDVLDLLSLPIPCPFKDWQAELVRLAMKSRLKCFEAEWKSRFYSHCEMIKVDLKVLKMFAENLHECSTALFKNTELCVPPLPDFSNPTIEVESTDGCYEILKSFDEKYPIAKNTTFYARMFSWIATVGKLFNSVLEESFMPADDSKATVRLFKIGKGSYVMAHELLQSMKNKNMDVSEFEGEVLKMRNLATFNFREVAQKVKIGDMKNIEFIGINGKVSVTSIPLPAPDGTYCVPATDALYDQRYYCG